MSPMASLFERSLPLVEPLKPGEALQRGTELYILSVAMVVVAGLFVAARISVRVSKVTTSQGLGNDDYCVIAALVIWLESCDRKMLTCSQISSVGLSLTEIEATVHGYGNHLDSLTKNQIHEALEVSPPFTFLVGNDSYSMLIIALVGNVYFSTNIPITSPELKSLVSSGGLLRALFLTLSHMQRSQRYHSFHCYARLINGSSMSPKSCIKW